VILMADHGEGFFEHGELQHGFEPFDEVTRIPLMIRVPSQFLEETVASVDSMVGVVDVMPTLLDIVGLNSPPIAEGKSLVPLLRGEAESERTIYLEGRQVSSLRSGTHKLFESVDGTQQCFDLLADPAETSPILLNQPQECEVLSRDLAQLVQRVASKRPTRSAGDTVVFDAEEVETLKSLGYLGD
jgi:arylsulfatase A-like enzyme